MKKNNKENLINNSLRRSLPCSKKEFLFDERVKSDNHLSVVDLNKSNQSVILVNTLELGQTLKEELSTSYNVLYIDASTKAKERNEIFSSINNIQSYWV